MIIELGNASPQEVVNIPVATDGADGTRVEYRQVRRDLPGPAVTTTRIPDGTVHPDFLLELAEGETVPEEGARPLYSHPSVHDDGLLPGDIQQALNAAQDVGKAALRRSLLRAHMVERPDGVTHLPDHELFVALAHPTLGAWAQVAAFGTKPTWVKVTGDDATLAGEVERFLADYWDCPQGYPDRLEDSHYTTYGQTTYPPGAAPPPDAVMFQTNGGYDVRANVLGGFGYLGTSGTATATSSTTLTGGTETGVSHATNDCAGQLLCTPTAFGRIASNTSGTTPVYTVDRWSSYATPGGSAASTPGATSTYTIASGGLPYQFVGLTANTTAPASGDTTLTGEITTSGGGLIRKITTVTHTAGAASWVATTVHTANGSDTLPVTVGKAGYSQSITSGVNSGFQTLVSPTAILSASGDSLTTTWTFS